jgi:hypothetical protein
MKKKRNKTKDDNKGMKRKTNRRKDDRGNEMDESRRK